MENKKKLEYYINRLQEIKDNRDDIKLIIEDSSETQENEYENNIEHQPNIKDMSLVPLFIVLVLGFNLIIYNIYSDDNIIIPFITFFISLLLLYKYVPLKAKKKFVDDFLDFFEDNFKNDYKKSINHFTGKNMFFRSSKSLMHIYINILNIRRKK